MKKAKSCGVIIQKSKKFLLIKHRSDKGGHWGFPKGHIEKGESEEETAYREVLEETGIRVELLKGFKEKVEYKAGKYKFKTAIYFIGRPEDEKVVLQEEEIEDYEWLSYKKAMLRLKHTNEKNLLRKAYKYLKTKKA